MESDKALHETVAQAIAERIRSRPNMVLGLATGSTPMGVYRQLVEDHRIHGTSYRQVKTFNLEEYIGLGPYHPQSCW